MKVLYVVCGIWKVLVINVEYNISLVHNYKIIVEKIYYNLWKTVKKVSQTYSDKNTYYNSTKKP
jgi:hypothetical protein